MLPVLRNNTMLGQNAAGPVNRLDALFDRFFSDDFGPAGQTWSWAPVAMWEDDDHVHVEAELPGLSDQDIEVTVHDGVLYIRGERKPAEGRKYVYNGRSYGRFERVITLPERVNADDVQATMTDGVLTIDLPKSPEAKPKRITVKAGPAPTA
jgi:HSP20 family protein